MSNTAFDTYLAGGQLPPITQALCQTWNHNQQAIQMYGPTPTAHGIAALIDAVHSLETAVIALQGG